MGLVSRLIVIISALISISALLLIVNTPTGVAVDCKEGVKGFGVSGYPLTSYKTGCSVEVEVLENNETVCTGKADVIGNSSIVSCKGLEKYEGENLTVKATFYKNSKIYKTSENSFINQK